MKYWMVFSLAVILALCGEGDAETYAASLGGAPVGLYEHTSDSGGAHVYGSSLGGAPVGIYEKDSRQDYHATHSSGGHRQTRPLHLSGPPTRPPIFHLPPWFIPPVPRHPPHYGPSFPHASVATAGAISDSFHHKTESGSYGYEGHYNPLPYNYVLPVPVPRAAAPIIPSHPPPPDFYYYY